MARSQSQLAQVNLARMRAPADSPIMQGFVARLDDINALADRSPGFVWRLQTPEGDDTAARIWGDDLLVVNMSVWESLEDLRNYVYSSGHVEVMRRRREWFESIAGTYLALWWVPRGHVPSAEEARDRLNQLQTHGPTQVAFNFARPYAAPDQHPGPPLGEETASA